MDEIQNIVNALYKEWLKTNDPFTEDFENYFYNIAPSFKLTKLSELEWLAESK